MWLRAFKAKEKTCSEAGHHCGIYMMVTQGAEGEMDLALDIKS